MTRRSTPAAKHDERRFPIRLLFRVPGDGLGRTLDDMHDWLREHVARQDYAVHACGRGPSGDDRMAVYFREIGPAVDLLRNIPALELSDDTMR